MELLNRATVAVLLLSAAFVGLGASSAPTDLLARLRRSAGNTAGPVPPSGGTTVTTTTTTPESGVPTAEPSVSTASASPSPRVARQAPVQPTAADALSRNYAFLHVHAIEVAREHRTLYSNYKRERFADDANPIVRDMGLQYLPSAVELPNLDVRSSLSDTELVSMHYVNLIIFRDTLVRVRDSETASVSEDVDAVVSRLQRVISRLESTMILSGEEDSILRVQSSIDVFHGDVTSQERNTRTLFVFQEFHLYMQHARRDYRVLANRHQ